MTSTLFHASEQFYEAALGDTFTVRDGLRRVWLAWEDEGGDWWAIPPTRRGRPYTCARPR